MTKRKTALDGAYLKGLHAGLAGGSLDDCPYPDKRKVSRAFRIAWADGWHQAQEDREQALITAQHAQHARRPKSPQQNNPTKGN